MGIIPHLATFDTASLPAGSRERIADIVAYCQTTISTLPERSTRSPGTVTEHMLEHRALTNSLVALGTLHR